MKEFSSEFLEKTVTISVSLGEAFSVSKENIFNFWKPVFGREKEKGSTEFWIDQNTWRWFEGQTFSASGSFDFALYRFKNNILQGDILKEGELKNIKHIYTYSQALCIIREVILLGQLDVICNGVLCYFKIENNETLYRLKTWRDPVQQLKIDVREVLLDDERNKNGGVCFDNEQKNNPFV